LSFACSVTCEPDALPPTLQEGLPTEHIPQFRVVAHVGGIQIVSHRAFEQGRILWNDRQSSSHVQQPYRTRVEIIDGDVARCWLDDTEQRKRKGRLASPCPTYYANLLVALELEVDVFQDEVQTWSVSRAVVVEFDCSLRWPVDLGSRLGKHLRSFAWQPCVF
jgi:hypothetical protein